MSWNDLSMKDKASYIRMGVENGITDLDTIREVYNKFAEGGPVKKGNYYYADSDTTDPNFTDLTPIGEGVYKNKFGKVVYDTTKVTPPEKDKSINDNLQTAYAKGIPSGTMASDMETMNAVTGGALNWIMPSQVAGGNTSTKMRVIDGDALGNQYGVTQITDLWDLQPFQKRIIDFQNNKIAPLYNKIIGKPFRAVGKYIIEKGQDLKYDNKAINDYLKNASEWDREMFDSDMFITENKWKSKIGDNIVKLGKNIEEKGYYHKSPLLSKIGNIEMSQLIPGAKPFNIEYTIPWTEKYNVEKGITEFFRGFDSNDILPPKVSEFKQMNPHLNYDYKGPSQFANGGPLKKSYKDFYRDRAGRFDDVDYSYLDNYLGNKKALGGNLYGNGGSKPRYRSSSNIRKQISTWEGATMKTNTPFEKMDTMFNQVLPAGALDKLSQKQLDGLYSFAYNVGTGRFKTRTAPTLSKYLAGQATLQDVQNTMWAAKDSKLRGLANRRKKERSMLGAYVPAQKTIPMTTPLATPLDITPVAQPIIKSNPVIQDNIETFPLAFNIESQEESDYTPGFFDYVNYINQIRQPKQRDRRIWLTI